MGFYSDPSRDKVEGIAVGKTLSWVTVGLIAVVVAGSMVAAATRAWRAPESAARDVAVLTQQMSQLEASQQAVSSQHAELTSQMAALKDQISALASVMDKLEGQQANVGTPARTASIDEPEPAATAAYFDDNSSLQAAEFAPRSLRGIATTPGQVLVYEVTGSIGGSVWGTDVYTDDSSIAAAAVHAGLLQPDETGTIMVTVQSGRENYRGSARNGVASKDYLDWERSYTLQRLQ